MCTSKALLAFLFYASLLLAPSGAVGQGNLRVWLLLNEEPQDSLSEQFDVFADRWASEGLHLGQMRQKTQLKPGFLSHLLGQETILSEIAAFRQREGIPAIEVHFFDWSEYWETARSHPTGLQPDLIQVPSTWCSSLAAEFQILAPITTVIDEKLRSNFEPKILAPCLVYGQAPLYGLPWLLDVRLLYFWREQFGSELAELPHSSSARESFKQALRNGRQNASYPHFAIPIARDWELVHHLALITWGQSGELLATQKQLGRRVSSPQFEEAALRGAIYLRNLLQSGLISFPETTRQELERQFVEHQLGSLISGPWLIHQLQESLDDSNGLRWDRRVGVSLPPFYEAPDEAVTFIGGSFLGITNARPQLRDEALKLAEYLTLDAAAFRYAEAVGLIPAAKLWRGTAASALESVDRRRSGALCTTFYDCLSDSTAGVEAIQVIARSIEVGRSYPSIPQWWALEVPGSLGPVHFFWQQLATLQAESVLEAALRRISLDWEGRLESRSPWMVIVSLAGFAFAAMAWWSLARRRGAQANEVASEIEPVVKPLGQRLRAARHNAGHSQEKAAADIGIDTSTLSRIEREKQSPHPSTEKSITDYIQDHDERAPKKSSPTRG